MGRTPEVTGGPRGSTVSHPRDSCCDLGRCCRGGARGKVPGSLDDFVELHMSLQ